LFSLVPQQFFPSSSRLELMVDMKLEEGASLTATQEQALRLEAMLAENELIENYVGYMGSGSPRYSLSLARELPGAWVALFVILTRNIEEREQVMDWLEEILNRDFPMVRTRVARLENGPPVGYPLQFRVSGEHIPQVRELARRVAEHVRDNHCRSFQGKFD